MSKTETTPPLLKGKKKTSPPGEGVHVQLEACNDVIDYSDE